VLISLGQLLSLTFYLPVLNLLRQWPKISIFAPAGKTVLDRKMIGS